MSKKKLIPLAIELAGISAIGAGIGKFICQDSGR